MLYFHIRVDFYKLSCFPRNWHRNVRKTAFVSCSVRNIYRNLRDISGLMFQKASRLMKHHNDVIKWKHFPRYWPFVRGIQRSPVNSPHKGQCRGALMFSLICTWINGWINNRKGWWFETPSRSLWRHCNVFSLFFFCSIPILTLCFLCRSLTHLSEAQHHQT